jgi:hypothetical protein
MPHGHGGATAVVVEASAMAADAKKQPPQRPAPLLVAAAVGKAAA